MNRDDEIDMLAQKLWNYHHLNQPLKKADCIIGLGSYDLRVAEKCAELYFEKWAPLIIFSGGLGNWTKKIWSSSEAEIFREYAINNKGVPSDAIKIENKSSNIGENIMFTKNTYSNLLELKTVIVVTKPNTERRVFATFKKRWENVNLIVNSPTISFSDQPNTYILKDDLINEMVGDLQRIKIYPTLVYQISQEIPNDVWSAYEKLISLNYNKHLIIEH